MSVRRMAVGGSWYPGNAKTLAAEVDGYVNSAVVDAPTRRPVALIAPHAGLMYSGPVAAFAYKVVKGTPYRAAILLGPSHFVPFDGVSVWAEGSWETPFGPVPVDQELATAIRAQSPLVIEHTAAHGREHSLEMQLPFLAHLLPGTSIVPMVMGHQTRETALAIGDALASVLRSRHGEALIVASSDLSHYEDAAVAAVLDAVVIRHVEAMDPGGLMSALEHEPRHACGGGPMVSVLHAARALGATEAHVLRYADSGDVSGDKSSVVGYMAAAIW